LALLGGYVYGHVAIKWLGVKRQSIFHLVLLWSALILLPIGIAEGLTAPVSSNPILWVFLLLLTTVGLPFFVISSTAPVLQKWFSMTIHPSAKDPYFLYSTSNLGSMVGLLAYPFLVEPFLTLKTQSTIWGGGYVLMAMLISGCAISVWRPSGKGAQHPGSIVDTKVQIESSVTENSEALKNSQRIRWVLLAFAPSSLLLGVTQYITLDIAQIPLLWIVPLAIYLLTFILVFAKRPLLNHRWMVWAQPFLLVPLIMLLYWNLTTNIWFSIPLHLITFFIIAMVCHGELANTRPSTAHLTEFYLWLSVGGVLGGLFNALVAPHAFHTLAEYPLVIALASLLRPSAASDGHKKYERWFDLGLPLAFFLIISISKLSFTYFSQLESSSAVLLLAMIFISCIIGVLLYSFRQRPTRFGLGMAAVVVVSFFSTSGQNQVLHSERNFFGILNVSKDPTGHYHLLQHGTIIHGAQCLDPARRHEPLIYYSRTGPVGQVFEAFSGKPTRNRVAIIGLGPGTIASYAEAGQHWTFYEINPAVERIARNTRYFTFLKDCPAKVDVVLGDARLSLKQCPDTPYDLLVLDAFNSDSIPVHLLTREALKLYLSKLAADGILAFHISNKYLNLEPVVGNLALDANLACFVREDTEVSENERKAKKAGSVWVALARQMRDLRNLAEDPRWKSLEGHPGARPWTDDYSNIPGVFKWFSSEK
jgi:SAM-dependent methyltransferase